MPLRSPVALLNLGQSRVEHRHDVTLPNELQQRASFAIAAGVSLFELARFMGTSVDQIDRTYGHLLPDALDRTRDALDAFTERGGTLRYVRADQ